PELQGLVTNEIESLGSEEQKLLNSSYPGTDFTKCVLFQEGREPAGSGKVFGMVGGGAALMLLGIVFGLVGIRRGRRAQPGRTSSPGRGKWAADERVPADILNRGAALADARAFR